MIDWLPTAVETQDKDAHRFLKMAYQFAAKHATDPSTQNGACIVYMKKAILGANRFPDGVHESPERWERPEKYEWVEHAERDAIYQLAKHGYIASVQGDGAVMYCTWYACTDCARAIIGAGIRRVVGHKAIFEKTPERWQASIQKAFVMLNEAGVTCELYDGEIGDVAVRFDGEIWHP